VVAGQKIKLFFNQLVRADLGEPDIATLALPVAIIATDIGNGERVVFRSGPLTQAMRASMSVPGLMAPAEVGGRKLVDGGLVDNLPVARCASLCRPDVVIAVNVGSPLLKAEDVGSLLSVTAQMVNILTEQNVQRSIASLGRATSTCARPRRHHRRRLRTPCRGPPSAAAPPPKRWPRGCRAVAAAAAFAQWRQRFEQASRVPPRVDAIEIAQLRACTPEVIRRHLRQRPGETLDTTRLGRDLVRIYGEGDFEGVDYRLLTEGKRNVLRIEPTEKSWGPDYLRLGLALSSTLSQGASYSLRVAWHKHLAQRLGRRDAGGGRAGRHQRRQPSSGSSRWPPRRCGSATARWPIPAPAAGPVCRRRPHRPST
jgi:NTE family protein